MNAFSLVRPYSITGVSIATVIALVSILVVSRPAAAAVDTGDNPLCGKDGACNLAVCNQDPDCPVDLPPGNGADPPTTSITFTTIDCSDAQDLDIRAVAWNLADDWTNFDRSIETQTGTKLGNCTRDRFKKNGKVQCLAKYDCSTKNGVKTCQLGFGGGLGQKIKIFPTFFDNVAKLSQPDRRACYAGLMSHEFAHTCEHYGEKVPEARANAAVEYWKGRFAPTSTLNPQVGCGFND
jgi:hypothetical protein